MDEEQHNVKLDEDVAAAAATTTTTEGNVVISKDPEDKQVDGCLSAYQPCTFRPNSINSERRVDLLPAYPLAKNDNRRVLLLLSNVPNMDRDRCEKASFCGGYGVCPFEFKQHRYVEPVDSFTIDLYQDRFFEPSRKWKIPYSH